MTTKAELVDAISTRTGVSKTDVEKVLKGFEEEIGRVVANRLAQRARQIRQVDVGDEDPGPEALVELLLGERPRPLGEQEVEQGVLLERQVHLAPVAHELPGTGVQLAVAEAQSHEGEGERALRIP